MKKKVILACTRRRVSEYIREQLEKMLGEYADFGMLLVNQEMPGQIRCDLVVAISEETAKQVAPLLMGGTELIVLRLTIQRSMYDRLKAIGGEEKALVVNNTQELALETVALLYALDVKNIELIPFYPGCTEDYSHIRSAITPNEFAVIPDYIERVLDIGERCLDPLTLIEICSRLDCLNQDSIDMIFAYGQNVISVNRGITELTRNGRSLSFGQKRFLENFDDAVFITDAEGKLMMFNQAARGLLGNASSYMLDREISELLPELSAGPSKDGRELHNFPVTINGKRYLLTKNPAEEKEHAGTVYVLKSLDAVRSLYTRYAGERTKRGEIKYGFDDILGSSQAMRAVKEKARLFAGTEFPILIQGESGTGKELFAQAIHQASPRKDGPFLAFNCAALTDSLLESELFGYSDGAFTGARKNGRAGIFEMASGGTLFMDEIGDVSLNVQAKILRVLQEQEVVRVGGTEVIPVNLRIISATNQDLGRLVKEKKFRLDLYYRLNTLILQTVPLRERARDIYDMLPEFFKKNKIKKNIGREAMDFMLRYSWPGNVRELQNCVSYLSIVQKDTINLEDFPEYMQEEARLLLRGERKDAKEAGQEPELLILKELENCRESGEKIGRKRLAEALGRFGVPVSEAEIRVYLEKLRENGWIEVSRGRGGTRITEAGKRRLEEADRAENRETIKW